MDVLSLIAGAILGGMFSWGISAYYYKKSNEDQRSLFNKLSSDVRQAILGDARENLTVRELNGLLEAKVLDEEAATHDPLPYKACPTCGNEELVRTSHLDREGDEEYYVIGCTSCGWSDWSQ